VSVPRQLDRQAIQEILASFPNRSPGEAIDVNDSLELAWLIHRVEQSHGRELDLDVAQLARMSAVTGVVEVLREAMATGT
jgi:hypothetical protein